MCCHRALLVATQRPFAGRVSDVDLDKDKSMTDRMTRRSMLKYSTLATGFWITPELRAADSKSPNEKLNIACIGVGGRGLANVKGVAGQNVVAFCDVDDERAAKTYEQFPRPRKFHDYRVMFDEMEQEIDAVVVSTPDHTHFHPSMMAMQRGKHLYCEKPMAHNVWEVRTMTEYARQQGVATQLGCQRHALAVMHRSVELIQSGAIGKVSEVYCWIDGDRGMPEVPDKFPAVPPHVNWDLWLGPAKRRPYHSTYCPYGWRFWWDFGTGETGNWGCHTLDIPFWALGLKCPTRVEATGPPIHAETTPKSMHAQLYFEPQDVVLHWQHVKTGPPLLSELGFTGEDAKKMNTIFIGDEGMLVTGFDKLKLLPEVKFSDFQTPPKTIPDSPGFYREWISACKGGPAATCHFDYTGPLAETVLLANVAYRAGGGFEWNAADLTASGNSRATGYLRSEYRQGWEADFS